MKRKKKQKVNRNKNNESIPSNDTTTSSRTVPFGDVEERSENIAEQRQEQHHGPQQLEDIEAPREQSPTSLVPSDSQKHFYDIMQYIAQRGRAEAKKRAEAAGQVFPVRTFDCLNDDIVENLVLLFQRENRLAREQNQRKSYIIRYVLKAVVLLVLVAGLLFRFCAWSSQKPSSPVTVNVGLSSTCLPFVPPRLSLRPLPTVPVPPVHQGHWEEEMYSKALVPVEFIRETCPFPTGLVILPSEQLTNALPRVVLVDQMSYFRQQQQPTVQQAFSTALVPVSSLTQICPAANGLLVVPAWSQQPSHLPRIVITHRESYQHWTTQQADSSKALVRMPNHSCCRLMEFDAWEERKGILVTLVAIINKTPTLMFQLGGPSQDDHSHLGRAGNIVIELALFRLLVAVVVLVGIVSRRLLIFLWSGLVLIFKKQDEGEWEEDQHEEEAHNVVCCSCCQGKRRKAGRRWLQECGSIATRRSKYQCCCSNGWCPGRSMCTARRLQRRGRPPRNCGTEACCHAILASLLWGARRQQRRGRPPRMVVGFVGCGTSGSSTRGSSLACVQFCVQGCWSKQHGCSCPLCCELPVWTKRRLQRWGRPHRSYWVTKLCHLFFACLRWGARWHLRRGRPPRICSGCNGESTSTTCSACDKFASCLQLGERRQQRWSRYSRNNCMGFVCHAFNASLRWGARRHQRRGRPPRDEGGGGRTAGYACVLWGARRHQRRGRPPRS